MTDLEITRLCAEAMEIDIKAFPQPGPQHCWIFLAEGHYITYHPLHDDAQAMALVKSVKLCISYLRLNVDTPWEVYDPVSAIAANRDDLNRAICECVAKMQQAKA